MAVAVGMATVVGSAVLSVEIVVVGDGATTKVEVWNQIELESTPDEAGMMVVGGVGVVVVVGGSKGGSVVEGIPVLTGSDGVAVLGTEDDSPDEIGISIDGIAEPLGTGTETEGIATEGTDTEGITDGRGTDGTETEGIEIEGRSVGTIEGRAEGMPTDGIGRDGRIVGT